MAILCCEPCPIINDNAVTAFSSGYGRSSANPYRYIADTIANSKNASSCCGDYRNTMPLRKQIF
jgi:hypothetical protein